MPETIKKNSQSWLCNKTKHRHTQTHTHLYKEKCIDNSKKQLLNTKRSIYRNYFNVYIVGDCEENSWCCMNHALLIRHGKCVVVPACPMTDINNQSQLSSLLSQMQSQNPCGFLERYYQLITGDTHAASLQIPAMIKLVECWKVKFHPLGRTSIGFLNSERDQQQQTCSANRNPRQIVEQRLKNNI